MKKKIIIIDNYDSFTYNLVHAVEAIVEHEIVVKRNDEVSIEAINEFEYIILSPGPGIPEEAGLLKEIIRTYAPSKKMLGVCLGLQAIGEVFGASLKNLHKVFHGLKESMHLKHNDHLLFDGITSPFEAGRYHSWVIDKETLPANLLVSCEDGSGEIMALRHVSFDLHAVQFHPESIMTPAGNKMLENFLYKA